MKMQRCITDETLGHFNRNFQCCVFCWKELFEETNRPKMDVHSTLTTPKGPFERTKMFCAIQNLEHKSYAQVVREVIDEGLVTSKRASPPKRFTIISKYNLRTK